MRLILKTIYKIIPIILLSFLLSACAQSSNLQRQPPEAKAGVIDLREWDFEKDGSIELAGEWGFFWGELLEPDQIKTLNNADFVPVPNVWTDYDIEGIKFSPEGYATYHLMLYLPDSNQAYGLHNEGQGSAYSLWVDGFLLAQRGQVGTYPQEMIPEKRPITVFFEPDEDMVDIVLQISNFHHRKGGFRNSILIGSAETIHNHQLQNWFVEAFSVGTLFFMGLYHFFIYIFRTKNKATLYFALLCWVTTLRIGVTNQSTLLLHFPSISWPVSLRIEYLTFYLAPLLFALFLQSLYPRDIHRWFIRGVFGFGIGFTLFLVFVDTLTLSYTSTYYQIVYLLDIIYYLYFLGRIIYKRREGAFYIGFASLIVMTAVIIDTLILQNILSTVYIANFLPIEQFTSFSFLAFIFVQAILLANLFSKSFERVETLSVELEETNINLEQSEKKYRTIFEDSKDMIFIAGLDGQIKDVSPACEDVLGYKKGELVKMTMFDVIVHPEDSDRFQKAIIDQGLVINFESELQRKDGQVIHTLVSATPRLDENGNVVGVQGNVRDITVRKQVEAERMRALQLEDQNKELDAFARIVAHDLKNPLATLTGYSRMLEEEFRDIDDDLVKQSINGISNNSYRMDRIINELFLLSKIRQEQVDLRPLNMGEIVDTVVEHLALTVERYSGEISLPESWDAALGYAPWIEEVWVNYITNGLKYGGQPPLLVLGSSEQDDGMVRFWVEDNGNGLTPDEQAVLFTEFTQLSETRFSGHGLGLSIVKRIIEKLGGQVGVESQGIEGKGSVFYFTLPEAK